MNVLRSSLAHLLVAGAVLLVSCAGSRGERRAAPPPPPRDRRVLDVPGHGALEIELPPGWTAAPDDEGAPWTTQLERPGARFVGFLKRSGIAADSAMSGADLARYMAEADRRKVLGTTLEKDIPLQELSGEGVHGFWFAGTDSAFAGRAPGAGEWRHLVRGTAAVGSILVEFTLFDDAPGPQRDLILDVVRGARHRPDLGTPHHPVLFEDDENVSTTPLVSSFPGKTWTVLVDLPGFRMFKPFPSYGVLLLGRDPVTGLGAMVSMTRAKGAGDARACREAAFRGADTTELRDLRLSDAGASARASYHGLDSTRGPDVREHHAHTWLLRDGICVEVHASKSDPDAADLQRIEAILASVRFGDDS